VGRVLIPTREVVTVEAEAASLLGVAEAVWEELLPVGGMVVVRQLRVSSGPQPGTPQEVSVIVVC
jgi:hypothetical protein